MLFKIFSLICLLLTIFFIQPTTSALPNNIQNLEVDDVTSLWDKFPSLIDKIKEAVSRFRCPKGWKRLGGSCYYFSNQTSTSFFVNYTCNYLHSNLSNLMQIRNAVELFYAAHVLSRNNLSSLMIDIDPNLLKGKKFADILIKDQGLWKRMKASFQELRMKYQKLKHKIVDRLSLTGLKILRRSKKIKETPTEEELIYHHHHMYSDQYIEYDYDNREFNSTDLVSSPDITLNLSSVVNSDEYEYDDLDSSDEIDEFEQIEDTRGICDDIHWNVLNDMNNSTVFILTKYNMSNKTICSLSDVDPHTKYHHVCEYVLDFCFANILCGKHGRCVNTLMGFQCSCSFLYGGLLCEKISNSGRQIIISVIFILIMIALSFKLVRSFLWFIIKLLIGYCKVFIRKYKGNQSDSNDVTENLIEKNRADYNCKKPSTQRRRTMAEFVGNFLPRTTDPLLSPIKRNLFRNIWVGALSIILLSLLFFITTIMYYHSFGYNLFNDEEHISINDTIRLVKECERISDYRRGNIIFAPFACALILLFSWTIKRESICLSMCEGRPGLIPPIEPFRTGNRFTTATVFGIIAFEVLKIFEELLFSATQPLKHGVLIELLQRIALVIIIGFRYYPVLASLQLRNLVARLFACLYIICNIIYTIVREGSCMGFLPLSGQYTELEEAKLRRELGTWFIIYGLIKNIPHFFFLSYIGAELCVRFAYDSIYIPIKKNQSIWSTPIVQLDESEFAKYYVTKLFRRNQVQRPIHIPQKKVNPDNVIDHEHEAEQQQQANQPHFQKLINYFYHFDDDFRFTTMAMSTYTVAVVFLYYLACTFVFLYVTRTTGHVAFLRYYFESTFNVDLGAFSFKVEIILSAVITGVLYAGQLFLGMKNYKKHKLQLYQGIYIDIPAATNFTPSYIASHSVHYSGFLVGYMAWGFVICFHLILLIAIGIKVLSLQIRHFEIALSIIVPIFVIYLLKLLGMTSAGKFIFIPQKDDKLNLQSRKLYAVFVYFSFFADCFLGVASCIIRLIKSTVLNVFFMARLDWSFLGRPLERYDLGFAAYISYLHMEAAYTNPIMLAFCYSLYDDIVQRRPEHCYVDECCISAGEPDGDNDIEAPTQTRVPPKRNTPSQNLPTVRYRPSDTDNGSIENNYNLNGSKRLSQIEINQQSSTEVIPEIQPSVSTEENQNNASAVVRPVSEQQQQQTGPPVSPREDLPSEDDDGRLRMTSFPIAGKLIPKPQPRLKSPTESSKIIPESQSEEDDDDGVPKRKTSIEKKTSKKRKKNMSKTKTSQEENGKDACVTGTSSTIQMIIPSKQPKLDSRESKYKSSSDNTDDSDHLPESLQFESTILTSHDAVGQKALKRSGHNRNEKSKKTTDKNPYETVLTEEEHAPQEITVYSPPPYQLAINPTDSYALRSKSYCQAQHKTPPLSINRSLVFSSLPTRNNTNDDSSLYSEITNDTTQSAVSNPSYSKVALIGASSDHSNRQQIVEEQKHDDDTNGKTQEEEEDQHEENRPLIPQTNLMRVQSTTTSTTDASNKSKEEEEEENKRELERIKQRKRLRFRWHLLYTLINNYRLFDLRKRVQSRLILLHVKSMVDEQQFTNISPMMEASESTKRAVGFAEPPAELFFGPAEPDVPTSVERKRSPLFDRLISSPASIISNGYPTSPAERYVADRAKMLYDANNQQLNSPNVPSVSRPPTTVSANMQPIGPPIFTALSGQSLGFPVSSNDTSQPSYEFKTKSRGEQMAGSTTARKLLQENLTSSQRQPASGSYLSTADYPSISSSIVHSSTFRTQMSYDQQMQAWRQKKIEKIQKKQRHGYVYGEPPQSALPDRVANSVILTPQIISTTTKQQQAPPTPSIDQTARRPTKSPFRFVTSSSQVRGAPSSITSDTSSKTKTQRLQTTPPQQAAPPPPQRMDRLDEDPQEISDVNKSSKSTSVLIHRKDSQSSTSDKTED